MLVFLFFNQIWSVISCYYNDLGIYNFELLRYTEPSFATSWLVLFYLSFNLGLLKANRIFKSKSIVAINFKMPGLISIRNYLKISTYIGIFVIVVFVINQLKINGLHVLSGISRVEAYRQADFLGRVVQGYGFILAFSLGFFRPDKRALVFHDLIFALLILYLISVGNKFSGLLILLTCYLDPVWVRRLKSNPDASTVSKTFFIAIIAGLSFVWFASIAQYSASTNSTEEMYQVFVDRLLATQGHLWWAVNSQIFMFDESHWLTELKAILLPGSVSEESVGMKYLMVGILGWDKATAIFDVGYLYTMAYPAILLVTFPIWLGLVIQFIAGAFFLILLNYLHRAINLLYFLRSLIAFAIIIPLVSTLFAGVFSTFATLGVAVKLLILLVLNSKGAWNAYRGG
jgi:hypothetical protein